MGLKDYRHDINNLLFKMETSAYLLKEPEKLSSDQLRLIADLLLNSVQTLKAFLQCYSLLEGEEGGEGASVKNLKETVVSIVKAVDPDASVEEEKGQTVFRGRFGGNGMDGFFIQCLKKILPEGRITTSEGEIRVRW